MRLLQGAGWGIPARAERKKGKMQPTKEVIKLAPQVVEALEKLELNN